MRVLCWRRALFDNARYTAVCVIAPYPNISHWKWDRCTGMWCLRVVMHADISRTVWGASICTLSFKVRNIHSTPRSMRSVFLCQQERAAWRTASWKHAVNSVVGLNHRMRMAVLNHSESWSRWGHVSLKWRFLCWGGRGEGVWRHTRAPQATSLKEER